MRGEKEQRSLFRSPPPLSKVVWGKDGKHQGVAARRFFSGTTTRHLLPSANSQSLFSFVRLLIVRRSKGKNQLQLASSGRSEPLHIILVNINPLLLSTFFLFVFLVSLPIAKIAGKHRIHRTSCLSDALNPVEPCRQYLHDARQKSPAINFSFAPSLPALRFATPLQPF